MQKRYENVKGIEMAERALTGTRVRNRRLDRGLRQAAVAKAVGISGSYLNLIEHNRRRIGAKLLGDLARVLEVDQAVLEDETSASIIAPLNIAAAEFPEAGVEDAMAEELVARFPGWAGLIAAQQARIAQLNEKVEALGNRLAHDTQISASLHEVISTATSIRSTASILVETPDLDREWRARFHGNIDGDSARLAQSSQALLGLLDVEVAGVGDDATTAIEQAEAIWAAKGFHIPELEAGENMIWPDAPSDIVTQILTDWAMSYSKDAAQLPLSDFQTAAAQVAYDPARLAARFGVPLEVILRRLAQLATRASTPPMGIVRCDGAGVVTFQKPILDFRLPRAGAACPLWPLFQAFSQPGRAVRAVVRMSGPARTPFECFAIANPIGAVSFSAEPRYEAVMLVRPSRTEDPPSIVGPGCRICPVQDCASRRQPSVLSRAEGL